ncbi:MAG TPA: hypothetical protein VNT01_00610 [Symbiobacteriaceae bacterium]|nr:hypothetical protein [Symbiobacteriaceae bacterium]
MDQKNQGQPTVGGHKLLNLRNIERRTKNMKDAELVIADGTYQGAVSALAYPKCLTVAKAACDGHERPGFWEIGIYEEEEDTYTARPSLVETDATIKIRWDEKNEDLWVDMMTIILARKMEIPKNTNVHIPMGTAFVQGVGDVLLLRFGQLTFQAVQKGKRTKKA